MLIDIACVMAGINVLMEATKVPGIAVSIIDHM